jgi:hypothetical protein
MLFAISGCKKDDNSDANNLTGTSWVYSDSHDGVNYVDTLKFTSSTSCTINGVLSGSTSATISISGTYIYEPPNINFEFPMDGGAISGTINGNTMTLSISGETIVYSKQ